MNPILWRCHVRSPKRASGDWGVGGERMRETDGTWRASERGRHVRGLKVTEGLLFTVLWGGEHGDTVNTSLAQRAGLRPNWAAIQPLPCRQTETHTHEQQLHSCHLHWSQRPRNVNHIAAVDSHMFTPNICFKIPECS